MLTEFLTFGYLFYILIYFYLYLFGYFGIIIIINVEGGGGKFFSSRKINVLNIKLNQTL